MLHELPNNHYAVQIPRDASNPEIIDNELGESWGCGEEFELWETLPSGQWQIVGTIKDLTTDDRINILTGTDFTINSLLASLSIEANNLLIIKKEV